MNNNQPIQDTIKLRDAISRMRQLTKINVPFSFSFISYSEVNQRSEGHKQVDKALLRAGYRNNQSSYSKILIAYTDYSQGDVERHFYLPLLMTFNNLKVIP